MICCVQVEIVNWQLSPDVQFLEVNLKTVAHIDGPFNSMVEHWINYPKLPVSIPHGLTISTCSTVCFRYIKFLASALIYKEKRFINTALHWPLNTSPWNLVATYTHLVCVLSCYMTMKTGLQQLLFCKGYSAAIALWSAGYVALSQRTEVRHQFFSRNSKSQT